MIAHILSATFVANVHLVAAPPAPDDAMQQKLALRGAPLVLMRMYSARLSRTTSRIFS